MLSKQPCLFFSVKNTSQTAAKWLFLQILHASAAVAYTVWSNKLWKGATSDLSVPSQSFWPKHSNFIHKIINNAGN